MLLAWTSVQRKLKDVGSLCVDVFISQRRDASQRSLLLLLTCSLCSLLLSSLLLLYLRFKLAYELAVAGGIAGCFGTLLTVLLFLSRRARCYGTLLVISVFLKKSRNLLLTAGTSLVVLRNLRNTTDNLSLLLRSLICNLKAKKAAIAAPLRKYKDMLKWVGTMLALPPDLGIVKVDSDFKISTRLEWEEFDSRLREAERKLNRTVTHVQSLMHTFSSMTEKLFPAISFLVVVAFIVLHVRRFHNDMKYKNKFIGGRFVEFDEKRRAEGKAHLLPLTPEEEKLYSVPSIRPTFRDRRAMLKFSLPVASQLLIWVVFVTLDTVSYWFVAVITTKLSELEPFHLRLLMNVKVSVLKVAPFFSSSQTFNTFPFSFQDIVSLVGIPVHQEVQEEDFSYSVSLFESECLPTPELLLHASLVPLAVILTILLIMILMVAKVAQLRLLVCERFFPIAAEARVEYLHAKILKKRLKKRPPPVSSPSSKVEFV